MKRLVFSCSRSSNPQYRELHKLADTARYNSATHNVAHYQDFPNRAGTPIKPPPTRAQTSRGNQSAPSLQELYIRSMLTAEPLVSAEMKRRIAKMAQHSTIRLQKAVVHVREFHGSSRCGDVMNDFHVRETNPGYARNELGGFFMR